MAQVKLHTEPLVPKVLCSMKKELDAATASRVLPLTQTKVLSSKDPRRVRPPRFLPPLSSPKSRGLPDPDIIEFKLAILGIEKRAILLHSSAMLPQGPLTSDVSRTSHAERFRGTYLDPSLLLFHTSSPSSSLRKAVTAERRVPVGDRWKPSDAVANRCSQQVVDEVLDTQLCLFGSPRTMEDWEQRMAEGLRQQESDTPAGGPPGRSVGRSFFSNIMEVVQKPLKRLRRLWKRRNTVSPEPLLSQPSSLSEGFNLAAPNIRSQQ